MHDHYHHAWSLPSLSSMVIGSFANWMAFVKISSFKEGGNSSMSSLTILFTGNIKNPFKTESVCTHTGTRMCVWACAYLSINLTGLKCKPLGYTKFELLPETTDYQLQWLFILRKIKKEHGCAKGLIVWEKLGHFQTKPKRGHTLTYIQTSTN